MVSWLKKLLGGGEAASVSPMDQTKKAATGMMGSGSTAATGAVGTAGGAMSDLGGLFGGGMPDVAKVNDAITQLPHEQLAGITSDAVSSLTANDLRQLGARIQETAGMNGATVPAGVASGNASDIGSALAGMMKGSDGLGALTSLLGGGSGGASIGGAGGLDLGALMSNPMAKRILTALIPAILKAAGK